MRVAVLHVVVPAHDEEQRIQGCLLSIARSTEVVRRRHPDLVVRTTVVLDRCTDRTATLAADFAVDTVTIDAACVGVARGVGVARARESAGSVPSSAVWVTTTDADSAVSPDWLVDQLALAHEHDLVVGRVRPDPAELAVRVLAEWERRHATGGVHVHGANLGFRLSAYDLVGGFPHVREHEDVALVHALWGAGVSWTRGSWVTTSARRQGRAPGGFAGYLRLLAAEVASG